MSLPALFFLRAAKFPGSHCVAYGQFVAVAMNFRVFALLLLFFAVGCYGPKTV